MSRMHRMLLTAIALVALALAACTTGPADGSGATVVEPEEPAEEADVQEAEEAADAQGDPDEAAASDEAEDEAALGTRTNPLPLSTRIEMGDWEIEVVDLNLDATEEILAENQFNDPPEDGKQFVVFTVEATYNGEESGLAWTDFSWGIVGSEGNTFDGSCGVIPDALDETSETFPGGEVRGNVCLPVETAQLDGASIRVEDWLSFDDTRAFLALE